MRAIIHAILMIGCLAGCASQVQKPELQFSIEDGAVRNDFFRDGPVAAHIVLKSAAAPRLIVAFPAGNSGVGIWFAGQEDAARWTAPENIRAASQTLAGGGVRRGVKFESEISASRLDVSKVVLSNVRVLRDYGYTGKTPDVVEAQPSVGKSKIIWERRRLDGAEGYYLSIEALNGSVAGGGEPSSPAFIASGAEPLRLRIVALTGDAPLTGIPQSELLSEEAGYDAQLRNVLTFLAYKEKLLAGSWQYNTYFGRDTLMSIALLGSSLRPAAIEAGIASVLDRLSEDGEVAHEEDISEYALLRRRTDGSPESDEPILDYKMIDDDFMLAPIIAEYLLDTAEGGARAKDFLSRTSPSGTAYDALVRRNLAYVVNVGRPYGANPRWSNLIRLRSDDPPVGEWRDSNAGLGGGMYPYDVNAALAPAALRASSRLAASGLLGGDDEIRALADEARRLAEIWTRSAPSHFRVSVGPKAAAKKFAAAATRHSLDPESAALRTRGAIDFPALALDRNGAPIAVMHSDVGFSMLFGAPAERELDEAAGLILRPFPAGLRTPAGMVVANAALAPDALAEIFGKDRYHGAVIWSWQQALMIAGIKKQMLRGDLSGRVRSRLSDALGILETTVGAGREHQSAELWTWSVEDGAIRRSPFGDSDADETESNAAQLWSTAHLAGTAEHAKP